MPIDRSGRFSEPFFCLSPQPRQDKLDIIRVVARPSVRSLGQIVVEVMWIYCFKPPCSSIPLILAPIFILPTTNVRLRLMPSLPVDCRCFPAKLRQKKDGNPRASRLQSDLREEILASTHLIDVLVESQKINGKRHLSASKIQLQCQQLAGLSATARWCRRRPADASPSSFLSISSSSSSLFLPLNFPIISRVMQSTVVRSRSPARWLVRVDVDFVTHSDLTFRPH